MNIHIGCDPEFILEDNGRVTPASRYLSLESAFGCDGANDIGELRPGYSEDLFEVIEKMRIIFDKAYTGCADLKRLRWLSGHYKHGYSIGGHVHIAFPSAASKTPLLSRYYDAYLSDCLSDLIDPLEERERRRSGGYGRRAGDSGGAIESKGANRFEYRTPGSWLISPSVSLANLSLAKIVTLGFLSGALPAKVPRNTIAQKREAIEKLWSEVPDLPEDLKAAHEYVHNVTHNPYPIDWNADFKEVWLS